jgi:hypothetical protein
LRSAAAFALEPGRISASLPILRAVSWHPTVEGDTYEAAREAFEWNVPDGYNAARDCLRKHDDPDAPALY